jgi:plastocyanin
VHAVRRLALGFAFLAVLAAPASASATTLHAIVQADRTIDLRYDDGSSVTHLDPGPYTILVDDSTIGHTFHLIGPNVDKTTGPSGAFTGTATWEVTLLDGAYRFFCDIHPGSMTGDVTVGNLLTVERVGSGLGTVTSSPAGLACGSTCTIGMPLSSSVTLTGAAATGSAFKGWSGGGCSGTGLCTVFSSPGQTTVTARFDWVNGIPPPPPVVTPPARITRVAVARVNGRRVVRVRFAVVRHTGAGVRLRRSGRTLASASAHLAPGTRTVAVRVPRAAKAGTYGVIVRITDFVSGDTRTVTRFVKVPAP